MCSKYFNRSNLNDQHNWEELWGLLIANCLCASTIHNKLGIAPKLYEIDHGINASPFTFRNTQIFEPRESW